VLNSIQEEMLKKKLNKKAVIVNCGGGAGTCPPPQCDLGGVPGAPPPRLLISLGFWCVHGMTFEGKIREKKVINLPKIS